MPWVATIINALWYILPAYVANASAPYLGGGRPIDLGKSFIDGKRLLGNGKTFKGFILAVITGTSVGLIQNYVGPNLGANMVLQGFLLSVGAMLGDVVASFIKRRSGVKRGGRFPVLDQLDFLLGALIVGSIIYVPDFKSLMIIFIFTPFIHKTANYIAYKIGIKDVPW